MAKGNFEASQTKIIVTTSSTFGKEYTTLETILTSFEYVTAQLISICFKIQHIGQSEDVFALEHLLFNFSLASRSPP